MRRKNLKRFLIFIGIISFVLGSACAFFAVQYFSQHSDQSPAPIQEFPPQLLNQEKPVEVQAQPAVTEPKPEAAPVENAIELNAVIDEAKKSYTTAEKSAKEGLLWIDKETGKIIVTLGGINGLVRGDELVVYEGDKKVGRVRIDMLFDSIAYVLPVDPSVSLSDKKYYKVVIE